MSKYKLKGLILMFGYDLMAFSKKSGIKYEHLKRISKSDAKITLDDMTRICRTLKLTPLIFFPDDVTKYHLNIETVNIQNVLNSERQEEQP